MAGSVSKPVEKAVEALRNTLHEECKDMPPEQFKEVLEEFSADIEGHLEGLKEEAEDG
jgi:hypothetical protein